jgi:hypothetical protein
MKVDCLMGTYGRYGLVCEALACFLQQTRLGDATLLIHNQHPIPLRSDHPSVRIVNEKPPQGSLRHIRKRMLELADPRADFVHWIDDDDLYLPWHLEDCFDNIGQSLAWKPALCWISQRNTEYSLLDGVFEGSWLMRADFAHAAPLDTHPLYTDHPLHQQLIETGRLATTNLGGRISYIYRWDTGTEHVSGYGRRIDETVQSRNLESWRERSTDFRLGGHLVPADMTGRWQQFLDGTRHLVSETDWESNRKRLGL